MKKFLVSILVLISVFALTFLTACEEGLDKFYEELFGEEEIISIEWKRNGCSCVKRTDSGEDNRDNADVADDNGNGNTDEPGNTNEPGNTDEPTVEVTYTVTFTQSGGTLISGEEVQTIKEGEDAIAPVYEKDGYLLEWDVDFTNVTSSLTVQGTWTKIYTVTFNSNGGTLVSGESVQQVKEGEAAVAPVFEIENYVLSFDKDFTSVTEDLEVTALYEAESLDGKYRFNIKADGINYVTLIGDAEENEIVPSEYIVPVTGISDYSSTVITSLTIPDSITVIENGAFAGCKNLATVNCESDAFTVFRNRILITADGTRMIQQLYNRNVSTWKTTTNPYIIIPETVTVIDDGAMAFNNDADWSANCTGCFVFFGGDFETWKQVDLGTGNIINYSCLYMYSETEPDENDMAITTEQVTEHGITSTKTIFGGYWHWSPINNTIAVKWA